MSTTGSFSTTGECTTDSGISSYDYEKKILVTTFSVLSDPDGLFDLVKSGLDPNEWNEAIKRIKKCQASLLKCPTPTSPTTENFRHEVFLRLGH